MPHEAHLSSFELEEIIAIEEKRLITAHEKTLDSIDELIESERLLLDGEAEKFIAEAALGSGTVIFIEPSVFSTAIWHVFMVIEITLILVNAAPYPFVKSALFNSKNLKLFASLYIFIVLSYAGWIPENIYEALGFIFPQKMKIRWVITGLLLLLPPLALLISTAAKSL